MYVQVCPDFDTETATCSVPVEWVEADALIQQAATWMTVNDAITISIAIGTVWAFAWVFRTHAAFIWSFIR